jgi:hypothetical protein
MMDDGGIICTRERGSHAYNITSATTTLTLGSFFAYWIFDLDEEGGEQGTKGKSRDLTQDTVYFEPSLSKIALEELTAMY